MLQLGTLGAPGTSGVRAGFCFTDRIGGGSRSPYAGLNLSLEVGDEVAAVRANREWLLRRLVSSGMSDAIWLRAEHGAMVETVRSAGDALANRRSDAVVTATPGLGLAALAADCALAVLADPGAGVVGVVHCGRRGLVSGVIAAVVASLRALGARQLSAVVGPTICAQCYELPEDVAAGVALAVPTAAAARGHVDLRAGVVGQLLDAGATVEQLVGGCTRDDGSLFSYRRDGVTGRQGALVWIQP